MNLPFSERFENYQTDLFTTSILVTTSGCQLQALLITNILYLINLSVLSQCHQLSKDLTEPSENHDQLRHDKQFFNFENHLMIISKRVKAKQSYSAHDRGALQIIFSSLNNGLIFLQVGNNLIELN